MFNIRRILLTSLCKLRFAPNGLVDCEGFIFRAYCEGVGRGVVEGGEGGRGGQGGGGQGVGGGGGEGGGGGGGWPPYLHLPFDEACHIIKDHVVLGYSG